MTILMGANIFRKQDSAKEFVGTHSALWGIAAGVYLASMGPQGMKELGEAILQRQVCLKKVLSKIKGVKLTDFPGPLLKR